MESGDEIRATTRSHQNLALLLAAAVILDGLDIKILAYAAPLIIKEWQIAKSSFGIVLAAAGLGMAVGTPFGGWAGDRWGRRPVVIVSLAVFGAATAMAAITRNPTELTALRFLGGLGCGAVTPNAYALISEWLPERARQRGFAALTIGFPVGGMLGALLMLALLPVTGWRGAFAVAGAATLLIMGVAAWWLPESPAFLSSRGAVAQLRKEWLRIAGSALDVILVTDSGERADRSRIGDVLSRDYVRTSLGAAFFYFSIQFVSYAVASWTPVIYTSVGLKLEDAIRAGLVFNIFAVIATFAIIPALRRYGSRATSIALALATAILLLAFGAVVSHEEVAGQWALLVVIALIGASCGALFQIINVLAVAAYPPAVRSTGVGFCSNGGRIGAFLAALFGGALLSLQGNSPVPLLLLLASLAVATIPAVFLIDRHLRPVGTKQGTSANAAN